MIMILCVMLHFLLTLTTCKHQHKGKQRRAPDRVSVVIGEADKSGFNTDEVSKRTHDCSLVAET